MAQLTSQRAICRWAILGSLCFSNAAAASEAAAEVSGRLRVVVLVRSADDSSFLERLRGQTVDLPIDLAGVEAPAEQRAAVSGLDAQVESAEVLARVHTARVIVWRQADQVVLLLVMPLSSRLLVRQLGGGPAPSSAGLEAAALIVRSALTAVLEGGTFGVLRQSGAATAAVPASTSTAEEAATVEPSPWSALLLGDFRMASDGAGNSAPRGFGLHLGVGWRRWLAGATAMTTLDRDVGITTAQPYWRQDVAGFVGFDLLRAGRARLTAEGQGGVAFSNLYRMTGTVHRARLLLGAELRGSFDVLSRGRFRLPVWGGLGADYIPNAPPLTLTSDGTILWAVKKFQPRLMLGTGLSF